MREFSVLIRPAPELEGQWVAHCLNWDLVSQGSSPSHAASMIAEAILLAIREDAEAGLDPAQRRPAPHEYWELFSKTQYNGTRIASADVDRLPVSESVVIAAVMYLDSVSPRPEREAYPTPALPRPFMIAELQNQNTSARG